jgi:hypothetical protein
LLGVLGKLVPRSDLRVWRIGGLEVAGPTKAHPGGF